MESKRFVILGFILLFSLTNIPGTILPVRIACYTVVIIPSSLASCLIFSYYYNIPQAQYSLMTTGALSVVSWHWLVSASTFLYLIVCFIFWDEVRQKFQTNGQTMCYLTPFVVLPYFSFSVCWFEVLRMWFMIRPFQVLDNEYLARPFTIFVPVFTMIMQIIIYPLSGTFCELNITKQFLFRLNIEVDIENLHFIPFNYFVVIYAVFLIPKLFLQVKKHIQKLLNRNQIVPHSTAMSEQHSELSISKEFGLLIFVYIFVFILNISILAYGSTVYQQYISSVLLDFVLFGLPFYWVVASPDIIQYLKLKLNQIKLKLGYF